MIVADTNLIAYLLIEGEHTAVAREVWRRDPHWLAPPLWRSEFLSVLTLSVEAGVLAPRDAHRTWTAACALMGGHEIEPGGTEVLDAALEHPISAYDAHFVVVAEHLGLPLVTSDRRILRARPHLALSPQAFARGSPA